MAEVINIQEWVQKVKEDPKNAAPPIAIFFGLLFAAYKFLYAPQQVLLAKQIKANTAIERQIEDLKDKVANKEELAIEVLDLRKSRAEAESVCYKKMEAPLFLQELRRIGKTVGIDIKSINPLPPVPKVFAESFHYEEYPVKIAFSGSFQQLGMFLRALEMSPKLISITLPPILPDASGTIKVELNPTTILIPEVQPTPAAAAQ
ncbi:MAG: type 4a pilus biogenesis protein PilO [Candidatus Ozemobacteraceae bacterium]